VDLLDDVYRRVTPRRRGATKERPTRPPMHVRREEDLARRLIDQARDADDDPPSASGSRAARPTPPRPPTPGVGRRAELVRPLIHRRRRDGERP
jgi:hypothetical protein